jgi:phosphoglucosamine mutase
MSNLGLERYLAGQGLSLTRTKVGDRYVVETMRAEGFNVGGEQSGHIVLSDYSTTGDGLVAALQVLAVVQKQGRPVSEVCHRFDPVPQVLRNVRLRGAPPGGGQGARGHRVATDRLGDGGRVLVRPSGTEPLIRVMGEGDDAGLVSEVVEDIISAISTAA